jgi:hypothetical protein
MGGICRLGIAPAWKERQAAPAVSPETALEPEALAVAARAAANALGVDMRKAVWGLVSL